MDDPTKPDLRISCLEHRSMRADAARLTELVEAAQPGDLGRLHALADWYGRYEGAIHDHHHAEDPALRAGSLIHPAGTLPAHTPTAAPLTTLGPGH
jgi:hypothetical protein